MQQPSTQLDKVDTIICVLKSQGQGGGGLHSQANISPSLLYNFPKHHHKRIVHKPPPPSNLPPTPLLQRPHPPRAHNPRPNPQPERAPIQRPNAPGDPPAERQQLQHAHHGLTAPDRIIKILQKGDLDLCGFVPETGHVRARAVEEGG